MEAVAFGTQEAVVAATEAVGEAVAIVAEGGFACLDLSVSVVVVGFLM
jgi:hypothetical protein